MHLIPRFSLLYYEQQPLYQRIVAFSKDYDFQDSYSNLEGQLSSSNLQLSIKKDEELDHFDCVKYVMIVKDIESELAAPTILLHSEKIPDDAQSHAKISAR